MASHNIVYVIKSCSIFDYCLSHCLYYRKMIFKPSYSSILEHKQHFTNSSELNNMTRAWPLFLGYGPDMEMYVPLYTDMDFDSKGNVYVSSNLNGLIQIFSKNGTCINSWLSMLPDDYDYFYEPISDNIAIDSVDNVYISQPHHDRVLSCDKNGTFLAMWNMSKNNGYSYVDRLGIDIGSKDNVYIADTDNKRIQVYNKNGSLLNTFGYNETIDKEDGSQIKRLIQPQDIVVDNSGFIYVFEPKTVETDIVGYPILDLIYKFEKNGTFVTS